MMSRITAFVRLEESIVLGGVALVAVGQYEVAYGNDSVLGVFIDILDEDESTVFARDSRFDRLTRSQLKTLLKRLDITPQKI